MIMSRIWAGIAGISIFCAVLTGSGGALAAAIPEGAGRGFQLAVSIGGSLCLWSGIGALMNRTGMTALLARFLRPLLNRLFPSAKDDIILAENLSGNICANILGLGNAATPTGIRAAKRMNRNGTATDELCRLIVLNTASIQLIPANVAAVRAGLGCAAPFDLLPAVWITCLASASLGVTMAWGLGKVWKE